MTYTARTKDAAGDVLRAADQNESVDNDDHLYAVLLGPEPPASTGGMVAKWVHATGIADATATEFCTIATVNAAGDTDGGVWCAYFEGFVAHGYASNADDTAVLSVQVTFSRALEMHGTPGNTSTVVSVSAGVTSASAGANKTITIPAVVTTAETTEYVTSVLININLAGATITTGEIWGMMKVYYAGFLTPPVITSVA
jgi:hypothetical protein